MNNHEQLRRVFLPKKKKILATKLMISGETVIRRKVRRVLRYQVPNKYLSSEKFAHDVLLLSFPFRDEKQLLSDCSALYQNKIQEQGV